MKITIVGYSPKPNKAVILISSEHHSIKTMSPNEQKTGYESADIKIPEIINHYNKNKGGVDTVDHLISIFTCRRKTNRWTMNCFYYL